MDAEGHLKIADFGLSVDNAWPGNTIKESGITGTPMYIAPEV